MDEPEDRFLKIGWGVILPVVLLAAWGLGDLLGEFVRWLSGA